MLERLVVLLFYIVQLNQFYSFLKGRMVQQVAGLLAFKQDGRLVLAEVIEQCFAPAGFHHQRVFEGKALKGFFAGVVMDGRAPFLQLRGGFTVMIEGMERDTDAGFGQCPDFVKNIDDASVIRWFRDIEGYDV